VPEREDETLLEGLCREGETVEIVAPTEDDAAR